MRASGNQSCAPRFLSDTKNAGRSQHPPDIHLSTAQHKVITVGLCVFMCERACFPIATACHFPVSKEGVETRKPQITAQLEPPSARGHRGVLCEALDRNSKRDKSKVVFGTSCRVKLCSDIRQVKQQENIGGGGGEYVVPGSSSKK